jgi:hypothetical protein
MKAICLQMRTKVLPGVVESYWFENENIGLVKTLFHRIDIPLEPFDSGLDYEHQPVDTSFVFDWYQLEVESSACLDGFDLSSENYPDAEASVYVGCRHNWCEVKKMTFRSIGTPQFEVVGELLIHFEDEGVGLDEMFRFETTVAYAGL